jgi:PAS domain-containing protein
MKSLLRFALAIGMVPVLALGLLMLTREVRPVPGLAALGLVLLGSLALAWGWRARLALLAEALRDALAQVRAAPTRTETAPLPSAEDLADGIRRLARGLAEQGALLDRLRRADAAILENLPEPVLLLSAERAVLRANPAARDLLGPEAAGQGPDAAALLRGSSLRLLLVGEGACKPALVARAAAEGLPVRFLDPMPKPQLAALLAGAQIGLLCLAPLPAFAEMSAPNKLAEGLAAGLTVRELASVLDYLEQLARGPK